jgi:hypothetical protein
MASNFEQSQQLRLFESGATRSLDQGKPDYEGFYSPLVVKRFGEYMNKHRTQPDGTLRESDNWQKGIPSESYMKSGWRHFMDWWLSHRGHQPVEPVEEALCALIFNASGYLMTLLKERGYGK